MINCYAVAGAFSVSFPLSSWEHPHNSQQVQLIFSFSRWFSGNAPLCLHCLVQVQASTGCMYVIFLFQFFFFLLPLFSNFFSFPFSIFLFFYLFPIFLNIVYIRFSFYSGYINGCGYGCGQNTALHIFAVILFAGYDV